MSTFPYNSFNFCFSYSEAMMLGTYILSILMGEMSLFYCGVSDCFLQEDWLKLPTSLFEGQTISELC